MYDDNRRSTGRRSTGRRGGISFCSFLFLVFLVLKLVGVIDWSWWWVTAPLWGGVAICIGFLLITLIIGTIISSYSHRRINTRFSGLYINRYKSRRRR